MNAAVTITNWFGVIAQVVVACLIAVAVTHCAIAERRDRRRNERSHR